MQGSHEISEFTSVGSIELGDYILCSHGSEQCDICQVDHRDDNGFTAGIESSGSREAVKVDITHDKEGVILCKKHKAKNCGNCHNMKKLIINASKAAHKADSKVKKVVKNF